MIKIEGLRGLMKSAAGCPIRTEPTLNRIIENYNKSVFARLGKEIGKMHFQRAMTTLCAA